MAEGDEGPEHVEDDWRADLTIVVKLSEVLDSRDPTLVVLEDVCLRETTKIGSSATEMRSEGSDILLTSNPTRMSSRT